MGDVDETEGEEDVDVGDDAEGEESGEADEIGLERVEYHGEFGGCGGADDYAADEGDGEGEPHAHEAVDAVDVDEDFAEKVRDVDEGAEGQHGFVEHELD